MTKTVCRKTASKRGIATALGTMLLVVAVMIPAIVLYQTIDRVRAMTNISVVQEEERIAERPVLMALYTSNDTGTELVTALEINNTGSIASRIRAVYVDSTFIFDPSDSPDTWFLNPGETRNLTIPAPYQFEFNATSLLSISTERGVKNIEDEGTLHPRKGESGGKQKKLYFGPLELNYTEFYYANCSKDGDVISGWSPAWLVPSGNYMAWNLTVKNIDNRKVTIDCNCAFIAYSLKTSDVLGWYIDLAAPYKKTIDPNVTDWLVFKWAKPADVTPNSGKAGLNEGSENRIFLIFFGYIEESESLTIPYAQTIPFEAVRVT